MANGKELNERLEYKEHIKELPQKEKMNFLIDEVFNINCKLDNNSGMIKRSSALVSSGIVTFILGLYEGIKWIATKGG